MDFNYGDSVNSQYNMLNDEYYDKGSQNYPQSVGNSLDEPIIWQQDHKII